MKKEKDSGLSKIFTRDVIRGWEIRQAFSSPHDLTPPGNIRCQGSAAQGSQPTNLQVSAALRCRL